MHIWFAAAASHQVVCSSLYKTPTAVFYQFRWRRLLFEIHEKHISVSRNMVEKFFYFNNQFKKCATRRLVYFQSLLMLIGKRLTFS